MARTGIPVTGSSKTGVIVPPPTPADPVSKNAVFNHAGDTVLILTNTGSSTRTVAIPATATVDGLPVDARRYTLSAGQSLLCGPFPPWWYGSILGVDADSSDITIRALHPGEVLPAPAADTSIQPFTLTGTVVNADTSAPGLSLDGLILVVDTDRTSSADAGGYLLVTV